MNRETIQDFTRRLSQCNRGELIIIMYDIVFAYISDAKKAYEDEDHEAYKYAIRKVQQSIQELMQSLDFSFEISKNLYSLYLFCKKETSRALYENRLEGLFEAEKILRRLYGSFQTAAAEDHSAPLMSNTQQVYAGLTYGRTNLNESYLGMDYSHRGFLA